MLLGVMLALLLADPALTGVVKDTSGAVVPGAVVVVRSAVGTERQAVTGSDGRFAFETIPEGTVTLTVRLGGFRDEVRKLGDAKETRNRTEIEVVLQPGPQSETVTVTPARIEQPLGAVPASVNIIDREDIQNSPAVIADDVLRQSPTFSLFRRTSAISANPTAQGVSLRSIGPSGVSRSLVMVDNVPFNDPFGGWVNWTRMPLLSVDRFEMVNNSTSNLYGNYAMGGVINLVSRAPQRRTIEVKPEYGSRSSPKLDLFASDVFGKVGITGNASAFDTDGFKQVVPSEAGLVDTNATVKYQNYNVKLDYNPNGNMNLFVRGNYFDEHRNNAKVATANGTPPGTPNGTPEDNDTTAESFAAGLRTLLPDQSNFQTTLFWDSVDYDQTFLAIAAVSGVQRASGRLTTSQRVPTKNFGGMAQWGKSIAMQHYFSAGSDWRWVDGDSTDLSYDAVTGTTVTLTRVAGGTQTSIGGFAQDIYSPTQQLTITASVRYDHWRNYDGKNTETNPDGSHPSTSRPTLPERSDDVPSPRIAALYRLTSNVSAWGDWSMGFRAPTLNELYRQFRLGAILTLANEELGPERLRGGELGVSVGLPHNAIVRTTWYDNRMEDPVGTKQRLDIQANGNTLQRVNLGRTRIWGLQTDADVRLNKYVRFSGGYLYNQAKVTENPIDPALVGKYLVQVPVHRGSIQAIYTNRKIADVSFAVQMVGRQFDDAQNTGKVPGETEPGLPGFASYDINATRQLTHNLDVFFGVQNLTDKEYIVQLQPTTSGSPRLVTGGFRVRWSGK
jgi:iron complex outermembrane receptor protein